MEGDIESIKTKYGDSSKIYIAAKVLLNEDTNKTYFNIISRNNNETLTSLQNLCKKSEIYNNIIADDIYSEPFSTLIFEYHPLLGVGYKWDMYSDRCQKYTTMIDDCITYRDLRIINNDLSFYYRSNKGFTINYYGEEIEYSKLLFLSDYSDYDIDDIYQNFSSYERVDKLGTVLTHIYCEFFPKRIHNENTVKATNTSEEKLTVKDFNSFFGALLQLPEEDKEHCLLFLKLCLESDSFSPQWDNNYYTTNKEQLRTTYLALVNWELNSIIYDSPLVGENKNFITNYVKSYINQSNKFLARKIPPFKLTNQKEFLKLLKKA